jgi:hypothetical protein
LLLTVYPLTMRKAFGRSAGLAAMAINLGALAATMAFLQLAYARATVPLMSVLGPLMVLQYACWRRKRGQERTTRQYQRAEPPKRLSTATLTSESGK